MPKFEFVEGKNFSKSKTSDLEPTFGELKNIAAFYS